MDIRNLIDYPAEQEVGFIPMDENIIEDLLRTNALEYPPEEADDNIEKPMIKPEEAVRETQTLTLFILHQNEDQMNRMGSIRDIKDYMTCICNECLIQRRIHDFFQPLQHSS